MSETIIKSDIGPTIERKYLDYAASIIVGRSLPGIEDGLKPSHRRILFSMFQSNLRYNKPHRKAARVIGDIIGLYHPHAPEALYEAQVRLGQDFVHIHPLIDAQGNVGSIDDKNSFAAMRYLEVRLSELAEEFIADLPYNCVDMVPNYDSSEMEPVNLPVSFPYFLLAGQSGIAVGFATSCLPLNLGELLDATKEVVKNPDISEKELMSIIIAPDFPLGGIILEGNKTRRDFFEGNTSFKVRSTYEIKDSTIRFLSIPYMVSKEIILESIKNAVKEKVIDGITSFKDLSDKKHPIDIRVTCRKDTSPEVIVANLFKYTRLEEKVSLSFTVVENNTPKEVNIKYAILAWLKFRKSCLLKKHSFLYYKTLSEIERLEGLVKVNEDPETAIKLIKSASNKNEAKEKLIKRFSLTTAQADYVVDLQVYRFTKDSILKAEEEISKLSKKKKFHHKRMNFEEVIESDIIADLERVKEKFAVPRRTLVEKDRDFTEEEFFEKQDIVIYLSKEGYIKRIPEDKHYTAQNRAGKGKNVGLRENDFILDVFSCSSHDDIVFLTSKGKAFRMKGYKIPEFAVDKIGKNVDSLLGTLESGEKVSAIFPVSVYSDDKALIIAMKSGLIKRTLLSNFENMRVSGLIACKLNDDDEIVSCIVEDLTKNNRKILVASNDGKVALFETDEIPIVGRVTKGVRGFSSDIKSGIHSIKLVKSMKKDEVLLVSSDGHGKRTPVERFRLTHRNTKGVQGIAFKDDNSCLAGFEIVRPDDEVVIVSTSKLIRLRVDDIRQTERRTYGSRLIDLKPKEVVVSLGKFK